MKFRLTRPEKTFSKSMDQINLKVLTAGKTVTILLVLSNRGGFACPFLMDEDVWPLGTPKVFILIPDSGLSRGEFEEHCVLLTSVPWPSKDLHEV